MKRMLSSGCDVLYSGRNVTNVSQKPAVSVCMAEDCEMRSSETSAVYTFYIRLSEVTLIYICYNHLECHYIISLPCQLHSWLCLYRITVSTHRRFVVDTAWKFCF